MIDTFKELTANQFEAAFCTLNTCIIRCREPTWNTPVVNLKFCQVAFHTLFFADYYLERNAGTFKQQDFHRTNTEFFRDYEELQDRKQTLLYDKPMITLYLEHCRAKAEAVVAAETEDDLNGPSGFERRDFSRAEMHTVNIRHINHHAAQLSMRLRLDAHVDIPWLGSGWQDD